MMKTLNGLETTLERVGRILSRKYDITVRCKADECKTDGRTIWLPALPEDVSESLWTLIRGELDHETAHILFSDFEGRMKGFKQQWGEFGFDLLNVIEDVRVNYAMQTEYPGSRENILSSIAEITQTHPIDQMPLPVRFLCGLFLAGMNLPFNQYGPDAVPFVKQFNDEAERFKSLRSTEEACDMAEGILARLKHQAEKQNQAACAPPNNGGNHELTPPIGNGGSASQSREDNQSSSQSCSGGQSQSSPPETDANDHQNRPGASNDGSSSSAHSSSSRNRNPPGEFEETDQGALDQALSGGYSSSGHPFELQRSILDQIKNDGSRESSPSYRVYDSSLDRAETPPSLDHGEAYHNLSNAVRPHVGALRQQLIRTLRARDARFWVSDQDEGRINSRKLYALLNHGSNKVFRQTTDCESDSAAVSLLIDLSGSMSGQRIHLARQIAVLFAETLNQLRIPSEVIGFTTLPSKRIIRKLTRETGMELDDLSNLYARFLPCLYSIFKAFEEPFRALKPRVPAMNALEYTPIDDAILFSAKRIDARKEIRKILLVLTDGEPYSGNPVMQPAVIQHLEDVLRKCGKAGVECVAIGVQTDYVQRFFQDYVIVQSLPELPKAFYAKFSELLRNKR